MRIGPVTELFNTPTASVDAVFSREQIGREVQYCEKCGAEKKFFVQHSHGNYPILDYVCPNCDLGGDQGVPDWYMASDSPSTDDSK